MAVVEQTGSATPLTGLQIAELAQQAGFTGQGVTNITAIALAESGGNPTAICNSCAGVSEHSVGLTQVNTYAHPSYSESYLLDPLNNLKAAYQISGGGTNFQPWTTYTKGTYKQFLKQAQADMAVAKYSHGGILSLSVPSSSGSSGPGGIAGWIDQGLTAAAGSVLSSIPWVPIVEFIIGVLCILIGLIMLSGFNPTSVVGKAAAVAA